MSETKVVRNTGSSINVEYGGSSYHFPAESETVVPADLADVAQYRHGHAGLNIVDHAAEAIAREEAAAKAAAALEPAPIEPLASPDAYLCPNGYFSSNDVDAYTAHLASAHGVGADAEAEPVVPVESPSASEPPAVAEIPSTEPVKES